MSEEHWKKCFRDSTTNIAFSLQVSKRQAQLLAMTHENELADDKNWEIITPDFSGATYASLERKGLLAHNGDKYYISKAGKYVLKLLYLIYNKKELLKSRMIIKVVGVKL